MHYDLLYACIALAVHICSLCVNSINYYLSIGFTMIPSALYECTFDNIEEQVDRRQATCCRWAVDKQGAGSRQKEAERENTNLKTGRSFSPMQCSDSWLPFLLQRHRQWQAWRPRCRTLPKSSVACSPSSTPSVRPSRRSASAASSTSSLPGVYAQISIASIGERDNYWERT